MPTHTFYVSHTTGGSTIAGSVAVTDDTELNSDVELAASTVNEGFSVAFTKANVQCLIVFCTAAATIAFYEGETLKDTIVLSANWPIMATTHELVDALLPGSTAPTSAKLTCADGGTFRFRAILNNNT